MIEANRDLCPQPMAGALTGLTFASWKMEPVLALLDVALLRAAAAKAGVSDITQKKDVLRFTLAVFRPEALVQVCGLAKYKFRLTLSAGETPMLTLKLKPGADVLDTALELVEDLKLAAQPPKQA